MVDLNQRQGAASPSPGPRRPAPTGFDEFFRSHYRDLVKTAMYAGATETQAEDAADKALLEMLERWDTCGPSIPYARKAVLHNFIKDKTRDSGRLIERLFEHGMVTSEIGAADGQLTAWEDSEWVAQVLSCLPQVQREVMERIVDGLSRSEVAEVLGMTKEAVRQNLHRARSRLARELHKDHELEQSPGKTVRSLRKEAG